MNPVTDWLNDIAPRNIRSQAIAAPWTVERHVEIGWLKEVAPLNMSEKFNAFTILHALTGRLKLTAFLNIAVKSVQLPVFHVSTKPLNAPAFSNMLAIVSTCCISQLFKF